MTTITVRGLGRVTIHQCYSEQSLWEKTEAIKGTVVFRPQAVIQIRQQDDVSLSGLLLLPDGEIIDLYSGGLLQAVDECIRTSFAFLDTEYAPNDFALA